MQTDKNPYAAKWRDESEQIENSGGAAGEIERISIWHCLVPVSFAGTIVSGCVLAFPFLLPPVILAGVAGALIPVSLTASTACLLVRLMFRRGIRRPCAVWFGGFTTAAGCCISILWRQWLEAFPVHWASVLLVTSVGAMAGMFAGSFVARRSVSLQVK